MKEGHKASKEGGREEGRREEEEEGEEEKGEREEKQNLHRGARNKSTSGVKLTLATSSTNYSYFCPITRGYLQGKRLQPAPVTLLLMGKT